MHDSFGEMSGTGKMPYKVRGVRDGIMLSFDLKAEPDLHKRNAYVLSWVPEAAERFRDLLGTYSTVVLEGTSLGETERIYLESILSTGFERDISVRLDAKAMPDGGRKNMTHIGTLRGGMLLQADSDLTVLGDVHAGARLEAGGSIFVLGRLFGDAWAGQVENDNAIVCAWELAASQIRIGTAILKKQGRRYCTKSYPECAYVQENEIYIAKYDKLLTENRI